MKKETHIIIRYLRYHIKSIILFTVFAGVFAAVFSLYTLPTEAVLYASALCLTLMFSIAAVGYFRFRKKHNDLSEIACRACFSIDNMPEPSNLIEADYATICEELFKAKSRAESDAETKLTDMREYYTLWAHQIKTPLAAMRLLTQAREETRSIDESEGEDEDESERNKKSENVNIINNDVCDTGDASYNDEMKEQLFRTEQYAEMVLQYLRSESISGDLVLNEYDIDELICRALRKYARSVIRAKISLSYDGTSLHAVTDEKWLTFVIEQLISNAIKYTPGGKICIYTSKRSIFISDTGIGIAASDLPRIFECGYTGFNGRAENKSTGIGLFLCKKVLKKLSHGIYVSSEVGKGTCFEIRFSESQVTKM
ncbi:MAG: sensor histidine kinase [Oscillospiraceae bacterium]|nr:sensor histidine kinase [Oscillospiraceae bacterium]